MRAVGAMTLPELQRLVGESEGEWERVEFKKSTGELEGGMRTLCAFLNGAGGRVFFGVTDAGKIVGQEVSEGTFQAVADAIRKIDPPTRVDQVRVAISETKEALILRTTDRLDGPFVLDGRPYWRVGRSTFQMPRAEYDKRVLQRPGALGLWERQAAEGFAVDDLDLQEIDRTLQAATRDNHRRPEAHSLIASAEPDNRESALSSGPDRAVGPGHPEDRRTVPDSRAAGAGV